MLRTNKTNASPEAFFCLSDLSDREDRLAMESSICPRNTCRIGKETVPFLLASVSSGDFRPQWIQKQRLISYLCFLLFVTSQSISLSIVAALRQSFGMKICRLAAASRPIIRSKSSSNLSSSSTVNRMRRRVSAFRIVSMT